MKHVIWSQWPDLQVPEGFTRLSPETTDLTTADLSEITIYVPQYMGGKAVLELARGMSSLKYLQLPSAGYDDAIAYCAPGVVLCSARGVHNASTAELAVALAIAARRGFAEFAAAAQTGTWAHKRYPSFVDSSIAILGAGSIATTLKNYLTPFNVEVTLYSRSGSEGSELISTFDDSIKEYDIVIILMPLNDESKNFFNAKRLAALKDGAVLINVGRGEIIDTDGLVTELESRRIFAGLDVTAPEPLPKDHPLWRAPNCIITPHIGGDSTAFLARGKKLVESQLELIARGLEPENIVWRG